jgi:bacillithiol disulfide reductase
MTDVACDVLVIGAGPIGLETAAILTTEGHAVRVIDAGPIGATIARTFPPHTRFFTSPERLELFGSAIAPVNQEKLTGEEYLAYLRQYVATHRLQVDTFTTVTGRTGSRTVTARTLSGLQRSYTARWLVLATGGTDRPRRLGVPGEQLPHVRSDLGDPHRYAGRRVVIVGGRNSAVESALRCYRVGAEVHLVHRRSTIHERVKFWLRPEVQSLLDEGRIAGHLPEEVDEITAREVRLASGAVVGADDVVLQIGYEQDPWLFDLFGLDRSGGRLAPVVDPQSMRSSVSDVFVVGTATAGTQDRFEVFIENSHDHGWRVAAAIAGRPAPVPRPARPLPEV